MSSLGDGLRAFQASIDSFELAVRETLTAGLMEIARVAMQDYIVPAWPVDTGRSRQAWGVLQIPDGARIVCGVPYSSFVHTKGAKNASPIRLTAYQGGTRRNARNDGPPIYATLVPWAVQQAAEKVGLAASLVDVTDAYWGQGRTTTNVTGMNHVMTRHVPPALVQQWRDEHPELIVTASVLWHGVWQTAELVPSAYIAAGSGGAWDINA